MANAIVVYREELKKNSWARWMVNRTMRKNKNNLVSIVGKTGCQPAGSKVLMADGSWKNIEDIKVGDLIMSPQEDGNNIFSKVKSTTKWLSKENYDVIEKNKAKKKLYSCSYNHIIPVYRNFNERKTKKGKRYVEKTWWNFSNYKAKNFSQMSSEMKSHQNIGFSSFEIHKFKGRVNCKIDPYTLGVLLGDGMFRNSVKIEFNKKYDTMKRKDKKYLHKKTRRDIVITSQDEEIIKEVSLHYPVMSIYNDKRTIAKEYSFSVKGELSRLLVRYKLEGKNSGTKFIPREALLSDLEYRKKLLAGLVDTDGYYAPKRGGYQFTLKSKQLIKDIRELVYSLGGRCGEIRKVKKRIKKLSFEGVYYSLSFYLGKIQLPLRCERKKRDTPTVYLSSNRTAIDSVKNNKEEMVYGFEIASPSKWYITDNWMVTHNSGKTWSAMSICEIMSRIDGVPFTVEHIVFSLRELMALINSGTLKKGSKIVFDEPQVSISAREFQSEANKIFNYLLSTFRHRNLTLFFCTPFETLLDKNTRKLFHARFETMSVNRTNKTCRLKPRYVEYSDYKTEPYRKQLIILFKKGKNRTKTIKLFYWDVPKPSKKLIEQYEQKKLDFTNNLNHNISERLEEYDKKGKSMTADQKLRRKPLTDKQQKVMEVLAHNNYESASKILGISGASIHSHKVFAEKKGYTLEEFKKKAECDQIPTKMLEIVGH